MQRAWKGGKGRSRKRSRKRERNKNTRVHVRLSPFQVHSSYETKPRACFPQVFLESLLARFAIFLTPAGYHTAAATVLLSSLYIPCTSRLLYTPPPSWCPFSTRNLLLTKDRPGRSSYRQIKSALHFGPPLSTAFRAHYALVIAIRSLALFFLFFTDTMKNVVGEQKESRRTRSRKTRRELFIFCFHLLLHFTSVCFFHPSETRNRDYSSDYEFERNKLRFLKECGDWSFRIPITILLEYRY